MKVLNVEFGDDFLVSMLASLRNLENMTAV